MATAVKILFINPFSWSKNEYPPLGIGYLISAVKKAGFLNVDFLDLGFIGHDLPFAIDFISRYKPDICAISLYSTNVFLAFELITTIKREQPSCIIIVGGPHATVLPERTMYECKEIDYLIIGEGELTLVELLENLVNNGQIEKVCGIVYRKNGDVKMTPARPFIENLDDIPFPDREMFFKYNYPYDPLVMSTPVAPVITGRGCPYNCSFCAAKAVWGRSSRRRSPENVVEEIKILYHKYSFREIDFVDDLFALDRKWLTRFYQCLEAERVKIHWRCLARPDTVTENDLENMKRYGCHLIKFGVESGNDNVLQSINKKFNTQQVIRAFNMAKKVGLNIQGFFIFGHPSDTIETMRQTLEFAKKLNPDAVSFFILVPFPGTDNYNLLPENEKYDWKRMSYYHSDTLPFSVCAVEPKQLLKIEANAWREFYFRLSYIIPNVIVKSIKGKSVYSSLKISTILKYIFHRKKWEQIIKPILKFIAGGLRLAFQR